MCAGEDVFVAQHCSGQSSVVCPKGPYKAEVRGSIPLPPTKIQELTALRLTYACIWRLKEYDRA